jgi:hypothetical protein
MLRGWRRKGWSYFLELLVPYLGPVRTIVVGDYRQMVAGGAAYHLQRVSVLYVGARAFDGDHQERVSCCTYGRGKSVSLVMLLPSTIQYSRSDSR